MNFVSQYMSKFDWWWSVEVKRFCWYMCKYDIWWENLKVWSRLMAVRTLFLWHTDLTFESAIKTNNQFWQTNLYFGYLHQKKQTKNKLSKNKAKKKTKQNKTKQNKAKKQKTKQNKNTHTKIKKKKKKKKKPCVFFLLNQFLINNLDNYY